MTLIELVVTLALLAMLVAVVAPRLRPPPSYTTGDPTPLDVARRAAIHRARTQETVLPSGHDVVISPLGTCQPAASVAVAAYADSAWDPVRCVVRPLSAPSGAPAP